MTSYTDHEYADADLIAESRAARIRERALWHWCATCHGHTGPGSPCAVEEEPEDEEEDSPYCGGCNPEPTLEEMDSGVCASCGKELA